MLNSIPRMVAALGAVLFAACAGRTERRLIASRTLALYPPTARSADAAATELRDGADLQRTLALGLERNAQVRAAFERWRAASERVEGETALPDPRFTYGEFLEPIQTRTGPQDRRFSLRQGLPWPGKLATKGRALTSEAEAAWQEVEIARRRARARIAVAYHEYAFLGREREITSGLLELVRGLEPVVQGRVRAGAGQADLLRLQVEIGRLEDQLAGIDAQRPALSARLAETLTLPRGESDDVLPLPTLSAPTANAVTSDPLAVAENPRLARARERVSAAGEMRELARYRGRPEFELSVDYIDTGEALAPGTPGSGDDPLMVGLTVSLPVWRSSYRAAESEARHAQRAAHAELEAEEAMLVADLRDAEYRVSDARRRMRLYHESLLPRAREALELTAASYRTGGSSVIDLLDAERALLGLELAYWSACRDVWQGEARLQELVGGVGR